MPNTRLFLWVYIVLLLICLRSNLSAATSYSEKSIEVAMRAIGHELLLKYNDSTSRVLPIQKEGEAIYIIPLESHLAFQPSELVEIVNKVFQEQQIAAGYILEVQKCETKEVVHAYQISNLDSADLIPCRGRELPKSCYQIVIELNAEQLASNSFPTSFIWLGLIALLFIAVILIFMLRKRKKQPEKANLISLGKFQFDPAQSILTYDDQQIALSAKETDLLLLLNQSLNKTIEKEEILHRVWGDEGDYVGRTLDVFISKLRKKLAADPNLKILNSRGVGYRLVMN